MKKKIIGFCLAIVMVAMATTALVGCGKKSEKALDIVYLKAGRGETYVNKLVDEYKKDNPNIKITVKGFPSTTIKDELNNLVNSGNTPDLVFFNLGGDGAVIERYIKDKALVDLSDVVTSKIPGEELTVGDKLIDGILNNYNCQPYGGGKTYLMPAFYSPTGLFYDASRFTGDNAEFDLPTTMEEFFALGDKLKQEDKGVHLFTYPTAGYFDGYIYSLLGGYLSDEKFNQVLSYADGIWEDAEVKNALTQVVKLKDYLNPNTVGQANSESFTKNQQSVIGSADGKTKGSSLFMPNGDWLPREMSKTTPEGFQWGFMPVPKKDAQSKAAVNTFIETMVVMKEGDMVDEAKNFIKFYYSDKAAKIIATESKAIIPTKQALANAKTNGIDDFTISLYDAYDGNKAVVGTFVATKPVADVVWANILFNEQINVMMKNEQKQSIEQITNDWCAKLESASDKLRANITK